MQHIPPSLERLQQWFAKVITSEISRFPPDVTSDIRKQIVSSLTLESQERMGIYQQQYWWRLISVLQELFPSVVAFLGETEFNRLIAKPYLSTHISCHWLISSIGDSLPQWLSSVGLNETVIELAELDLVYERLLFAEIFPCAEPSECAEKKLYLQPFVCLLKLDPTIVELRMKLLSVNNFNGCRSDVPPMNCANKKCIVFYRLNEMNFSEEISPVVFELLRCFQKGARLEEVVSLLEECEDVCALFQTIGRRGWLSLESTHENNLSMTVKEKTLLR